MSLWQILLKTQAQPDAALTYDECFAILDYLADQAADGANLESLRQAVYMHLARCPDCRERYLQRLGEMESRQAQ